jgi:hypothetical protein
MLTAAGVAAMADGAVVFVLRVAERGIGGLGGLGKYQGRFEEAGGSKA